MGFPPGIKEMITTWLAPVCVSLAVLFGSVPCPARDPAQLGDGIEPTKTDHASELSLWLKARFSEAELEQLQRSDLKIESYACSCDDKPSGHYPYRILLLRTPRGDLVARPEPREGALSFTALAVRYGNQYWDAEAEETCYGVFSDPCEFTDSRYGPDLAAFFPTCKSEGLESVPIHGEKVDQLPDLPSER